MVRLQLDDRLVQVKGLLQVGLRGGKGLLILGLTHLVRDPQGVFTDPGTVLPLGNLDLVRLHGVGHRVDPGKAEKKMGILGLLLDLGLHVFHQALYRDRGDHSR